MKTRGELEEGLMKYFFKCDKISLPNTGNLIISRFQNTAVTEGYKKSHLITWYDEGDADAGPLLTRKQISS